MANTEYLFTDPALRLMIASTPETAPASEVYH
jgi:hypothetical protein